MGAAGWFCLFLWPSLGLHPGIPGEAFASTELRHGWWLLAAACGAAGVATLTFGRGAARFLGLALLAVPFVVGAPMRDGPSFPAANAQAAAQLEVLKADFFVATAMASAIQWLVLGALAAWVVARWVRPMMNGSGQMLPSRAVKSA